MLIRRKPNDQPIPFAPPPWDEQAPRWPDLDQQLPPQHPARALCAQIPTLDRSGLVRP